MTTSPSPGASRTSEVALRISTARSAPARGRRSASPGQAELPFESSIEPTISAGTTAPAPSASTPSAASRPRLGRRRGRGHGRSAVVGLVCPTGDGTVLILTAADGRLICHHQSHDGRPASHRDGYAPPTASIFTLAEVEAGQRKEDQP